MSAEPRPKRPISAITGLMPGGPSGLIGKMIGQWTGTSTKGITNFGSTYLGRDAAGRSVYRVYFMDPRSKTRQSFVQAWDAKTGRILNPQQQPPYSRDPKATGGIQEPQVPGGGQQADPMPRIKDNALAWLATNSHKLAATDVTALSRAIRDFKGEPEAFHDWWQMTRANLPALTGVGVAEYIDPGLYDTSGFGGGGGGGGGFSGPVYRAPDRRVVEDFVKGALISLVGAASDKQIDQFADLYMKDHKRNFDSEKKEIDPAQSVNEGIRLTKEYQQIHANRPEGEDERTWIASRRQQGESAGLNTGDLDEFAINQATIAAGGEDVAEAAGFQEFAVSGQAPAILENNFRAVAQALMSRVAR